VLLALLLELVVVVVVVVQNCAVTGTVRLGLRVGLGLGVLVESAYCELPPRVGTGSAS
jgi:hypothetical protein